MRSDNPAPQVVIKVVSAGSNSLRSIRRHFEDLQDGKDRSLEIGILATPVVGKKAARALIKDWGLDADERTYQHLKPVRRIPRKLIHKLIFSMPAGTPAQRLMAAVRAFARQEFDGLHRYALALHTDEPHPHVHMVIRALRDQALVRLNIRKPQLRQWRAAFAHQLREHGVAAQATSWHERQQELPGIVRSYLRRPRWPNRARALGDRA